MAYQMLFNERDVALDIVERRPVLRVATGDHTHSVSESRGAHGAFEVTIDGKVFRGWRYAIGDEVHIRMGARTFVVGLPQAQLRAHSHGKAEDEIHADMPGTMIAHHAEAGQSVGAGDKLVTIESMKLQVTLVAPRDGVIEKIHVPAETPFERGALLVSLVSLIADEAPAKA